MAFRNLALIAAFWLIESTTLFANQAPSITLAPHATPNPAQAGQPVTLTVAASDPDGDTLTYTWTFGDGTPDALGATVTHVYEATGVYEALIRVQDGNGNQDSNFVGLIVNSQPTALEMMATKLTGKIGLKQTGKDTMTFAGKILDLPASGNPIGRPISVQFGSLSATVPLKGASGTANAVLRQQNATGPGMSATIKFKIAKNFNGGDVSFSLTFKRATLITTLIEYGYNPFDPGPQSLLVPFLMTIGSTSSSRALSPQLMHQVNDFIAFVISQNSEEVATFTSSFDMTTPP
ncbi:MAG TPA: PKD domain-containing protein [Planctomycetota bacterium]